MDKLKLKLKNLPKKPGSYQMLNDKGEVIYVGKAKNLKNRVSSYFREHNDLKTKVLLSEIKDFTYTVTKTELEALLLEINLIKKYNPKYNILLKDDKTYPYIELIKSDAPLLRITRAKKHSKKSKIFGPFPNVKAARDVINILNRVYPLRKCYRMPKKKCLYYHIGECLGYCEEKIDQEVVDELIRKTEDFLKGKDNSIKKDLEEKMKNASNNLDYEKALEYRDLIESINITLKNQIIDLDKKYNFDMFSTYKKDDYLGINIFVVREGKIISIIKDLIKIISNDEDTLEEFIINFYDNNKLNTKDIYLEYESITDLLNEYLEVEIKVPKIGNLKKLLDLGKENAKLYLEDKLRIKKLKDKNRDLAINKLNEIFKKEIKRIEAFDNSHLFSKNYVSGMVVFDYFKKNKNLYRKYKLNLDVKDDLSAFKEVFYRRYYKVLMGEEEKCDLVVVDGGINQVNILRELLDKFNLDIEILGLVKNKNHKTEYLIDKFGEKIELDKNHPLFNYLSMIQEEAHNFAISYHRNLRGKGMFSSILDNVKGLGNVRKKLILKKYPNLDKLNEASIHELKEILPDKVAYNLKENLNNFYKNKDLD